MKKILCIGNITTDIIISPADSIPNLGTLRAVDSISMHVGGCASNAAIDLGKLGIPVALSCLVGNDTFGNFVRDTVGSCGVDVRGVIGEDSVNTTVSVVCVNSSGERSFLYEPGSSAKFQKKHIVRELTEEYDIMFVAGAMLLSSFDGSQAASLMKELKEKGKFTAMDTAWDFDDIWLPKVGETLQYLDLFMPSYEEAVKLTGESELPVIADKFFSLGAGSVIIKIGKDGAYICEKNGERYILPTYTDIKAVDTTGAGDAFCAGFLAGLALGRSYRDAGRLANAVGTHNVMEIGASKGIKSLEETEEFMRKYDL